MNWMCAGQWDVPHLPREPAHLHHRLPPEHSTTSSAARATDLWIWDYPDRQDGA